ncbi:catecholate siderophore receptor [Azospirillum agricola]|uniref:TonB-dependent receptor n=1 Tax=Azospirillum agricola TaxID=1720247 RepID=UPI001AE12C3D|nr:TonB-dependent siderophore receptor [Azospirillum agricola]MBP2229563.1 catecholate siderophore receptor [Azospirillum agricola]
MSSSNTVLLSMRVSRQVATSSALGLALSCASLLPAAAQTASQSAAPAAATQQQLPAISVEGARPQNDYKVDRASSPKTSEPLLDTPQTITVIPREVIEDRGANSLRDVLRTVPGVTIAAGEGGGPQGDNLKIRGFAANTDLFIDGMRDQGQYSRDSFNLEQVEVVKGGSATSAGRGATGGAVNLVTKAPQKEAITAGTVALGTDRTKRITADLNQPLTALGLDNAAIRLNVMGQTSGIAGRDVVENNRWGFNPSITFGLTGPTKFTLSYFHLQEDNIPDYGIPVVNATSLPDVKRENYYGFKDLNAETVRTDIGTARLEHEFNDSVSVRNTLRAAQTRRISNVSVPRAANVAANSMTKVPTARDAMLKTIDNQTDVTLKFATGALSHTVVTGVELTAESYDNQPYSFSANASTTDRLFTPNPFARYTGTRTPGAKTETDSTTAAVYLMDTIKIGEQWEVAGGVRYDRFHAETDIARTATSAAANLERTDNLVSWRGAVIYKPVPNASVYASASSSYNPSAEGLSLTVANAGTPPEKNVTYEVGTKWDLLGDTLSLTGALFRTEKTNARETLPGGTVQVLNGVRRVDGIELGVAGHLTSKWQVFGGYTYQTSEIVETFTAANKGNELASTPKHTFSLWSTYELPWNLKVGGGVQYVADRYWSDANLGKIPNYAVFDAMAAYTIRPGVDLQLNVYNIADKFYIERVHAGGGHAVPGAGRTALLTTSVKF